MAQSQSATSTVVSLYLPVDLLAAIRKYAEKDQRNLSNAVRKLVKDALEAKQA